MLLLGTKTETAMDISIQPWMKTHGFDFPSEPWAAFGAGFEPGGDIFWAPLESHENSCVAFIRNDWKAKKTPGFKPLTNQDSKTELQNAFTNT